MAYRNSPEILFVRVPLTSAQKQKIDKAAESSGLKKYKFVLNALLEAADAEEKKHGSRN